MLTHPLLLPLTPEEHLGSSQVGITLPYCFSLKRYILFSPPLLVTSLRFHFVGAGGKVVHPTPLFPFTPRGRSARFYELNRLLFVTSKRPPPIKSRPATSTKGVIPPVSGSSPLLVSEPEEAEALLRSPDEPALKATNVLPIDGLAARV